MRTSDAVTVVRGEEELFRRVGHLFSTVTDMACAANDLATWVAAHGAGEIAERRAGEVRIRKIYRAGLLLDPAPRRSSRGSATGMEPRSVFPPRTSTRRS